MQRVFQKARLTLFGELTSKVGSVVGSFLVVFLVSVVFLFFLLLLLSPVAVCMRDDDQFAQLMHTPICA